MKKNYIAIAATYIGDKVMAFCFSASAKENEYDIAREIIKGEDPCFEISCLQVSAAEDLAKGENLIGIKTNCHPYYSTDDMVGDYENFVLQKSKYRVIEQNT